MLSPRSIPADSPRLPELANRGIAYALLALGLAGIFTELLSAMFAPRLVLFVTVLVFGGVGLARCRRTEQGHSATAHVMPRLPGSEAAGTALH